MSDVSFVNLCGLCLISLCVGTFERTHTEIQWKSHPCTGVLGTEDLVILVNEFQLLNQLVITIGLFEVITCRTTGSTILNRH